MNGTGLTPELTHWLLDFQEKKQRKLRVLHIGNIAANGFLNAKFMRQVGIEADVLCYDYYHIMAYPEWEEIAINDPYKSDLYPRFSRRDLSGYQRPDWFVQGPYTLCLAYFTARNSGNIKLANRIKKQIDAFLFPRVFSFVFLINLFSFLVIVRAKLTQVASKYYAAFKKIRSLGRNIKGKDSFKEFIAQIKLELSGICSSDRFETWVAELNHEYAKNFPDRTFRFSPSDLESYYATKSKWEELFAYYDVIQCYATDPIYGLFFSNKPYIAFEHGTLRVFTSDENTLNALTALAYRKAYHAFITNGDCLAYAQQLSMNNYSPMIHPVDVEQHRKYNPLQVKSLRQKYKADILLFCPLRHDWQIKGTDRHIRALPIVNKMIQGRVMLVMTNWGADLEQSKALAKTLGVEDQIVWCHPLSRVKMIEMLHACDVVLDQTILPCFGSTSPQALACGTPTLMSYDPASTAWLIPEPAPIIQATNEEEIAAGIQLALDPAWRADFKTRAAYWIDTYHSSNVALNHQISVYKNMLQQTERAIN